MEIIQRHGIAFKVIERKMNFPFITDCDDMLCEDVSSFYSDPNTQSIVLIRDNYSKPIMTYQDVLDEIEYLYDNSIRWRSEETRDSLRTYYHKVSSIMKTYKRQEQINKVLNSNECTFHLAC
jgi:hypothetical protein